MKNLRKNKSSFIALTLTFILLLSMVLFPLLSLGKEVVSAEAAENIYSAGNNYAATVSQRVETIGGENYTYDYARYNLSSRDNSKIISDDPPQVTFLTHGLGGTAGHWSNNGVTADFSYSENSIIELLKQKAECNVYVAYVNEGFTVNFFKILENVENSEITYTKEEIDKITDNTRHSIVVLDAFQPYASNDFVYAQLDKVASTVVTWLAELDANHELPRVNLIGHSRGGITNLQYAMDHPDIVDSVFSIATPYAGSTSASIDMGVLQGKFGGGEKGENDIINRSTYMGYMNRWNSGYNKFYSDIKVYAIGGYSSFDTLIYSLVCNYVDYKIYDGLLKLGLKAANIALSRYLNSTVVVDVANLAEIYLDEILRNITIVARESLLTGLTAALELLLCEIEYNDFALSYDVLNDGLVDLPSQLGVERETNNSYN